MMRIFLPLLSRNCRRSSRNTATSAIRASKNVADEIDIEDLIEQQDCAYTLTHFGYIKRQPTSVYRAQRRGGRGVSAMSTREEDFAKDIFTASTHDTILFFSDRGKVYKLKGYQIPETGRSAKGMNIVNLLELENGEKSPQCSRFRSLRTISSCSSSPSRALRSESCFLISRISAARVCVRSTSTRTTH